MAEQHSAADLEWAAAIIRDRPRLDALIQEMRDDVPGAFDEIHFLHECFWAGMPCADVDGRLGRLVEEN